METTQKTYKMLKTTTGSRDGLTVETFSKGQTYQIDESLAEQLYHQGALTEVAAQEDAGEATDGGADVKNRSTKVTGPRETKVTAPEGTKEGEAGVNLGTQHIEELVALARDHYGLDVDSTMSEAEVRTMIEAAQGAGSDSDHDPEPLTTGSVKKAKKGKR